MKNIIILLILILFLRFDINSIEAEGKSILKSSNNTEDNLDIQENKEAFIINCTKEKYGKDAGENKNCRKTYIKADKMINQNDLLFLGQKLYMDNYNPLIFNSAPKILDNSIYMTAP